MGTWSYIKGVFVATWTGLRHLFHPRMTLRYPEQKLDLEGPGYRYDAKQGVGLPGFKGRHLLYFEKCTGCQLCAIACDGVAVAIDMQKVQKGRPQNKKDIWPAVDYGRCVPPSTPIITMDGVKPISEVRVGDMVLTHTGKFRQVTRLFSREYTGKLYTFWTSGNPEPLTTTEDHPILVYGEDGISWSFANEIKPGNRFTRPLLSQPPSWETQQLKELYRPLQVEESMLGQVLLGSATELTSSTPNASLRDGMVISAVTSIRVREVKDFPVRNLEVDKDNSYVAANQSVHNCVFCGLCVDACPFDALDMTNDYELSAYDKMSLKYTPDMLAVPPKLEGKKYKVVFDTEKGEIRYG